MPALPALRFRRSALSMAAALVALGTSRSAAQAVPAPLPSDSAVAARVDEYFDRLSANGFDGAVLVLRNGHKVVERGYGFANRAQNIRVNAGTVWNLGSITKQFTAAAILRLEERGKLKVTDSIARFFPATPTDKRGITLHQLLTHTAGFDSDYSPTDYEPTTRDEYMRRMLTAKLRTPPGTEHHYANAGYSMLAAIVEIVTGREYEQALTELVLAPAGMTETGYTAPHWDKSRLAHGTQNGQYWGTIVDRISGPGRPYWELRGNGGLGTTLGDMAKWDAALENNSVLTDSSRRKFMTGYVNEGPEGRSQYAYGWAVMRSSRGTRIVTHNGGNGIFVAEWIRYIDEGITIFVASSNSALTATPASRVVSQIVFGQPYDLPPRRVAVAAASLEAAAGRYTVPEGGTLTLRVDNGRLVADARGQAAWSLLAGSPRSLADADKLNAKADTIVAALVRGDATLLHATVEGAPPLAEMQQQENGLMQQRIARWGAFQHAEVLGTVPEGGAYAATTVKLRFERGTATNIYVWNREGQIIDLRAQPYTSTELVPEGEHRFATVGARGGSSAHFTIDGARMTVSSPAGEVVLRREP